MKKEKEKWRRLAWVLFIETGPASSRTSSDAVQTNRANSSYKNVKKRENFEREEKRLIVMKTPKAAAGCTCIRGGLIGFKMMD